MMTDWAMTELVEVRDQIDGLLAEGEDVTLRDIRDRIAEGIKEYSEAGPRGSCRAHTLLDLVTVFLETRALRISQEI